MEKKLRYSRQRELIYEYLKNSDQHPSAEMIHNDLKQQIDGLSLGTVYRNLKLLEELGLARRAVSIEGTERYDAICGDHIHFLCSGCGSIQDAANPDAQKIWQAANLAGNYLPQKMDLIFTGLCPECAKNQ